MKYVIYLILLLVVMLQSCRNKCDDYEPTVINTFVQISLIDSIGTTKCIQNNDSIKVYDFQSKKEYLLMYDSLTCYYNFHFVKDLTYLLLQKNKSVKSKMLVETPTNIDTLLVEYFNYERDPICNGENVKIRYILNGDTLRNMYLFKIPY